MKAKTFLINLLEEDIMKAQAAIISINVDLEMLNEKRTKLEGKELEKVDGRIKDLQEALPNATEQRDLLIEKLAVVRKYAGSSANA